MNIRKILILSLGLLPSKVAELFRKYFSRNLFCIAIAKMVPKKSIS